MAQRNSSPPDEADVIVIGGGGAGLAAAVTSAELGASVILVEKALALGGTTALSVGSFSAAGTGIQCAVGVVDSAATFREDLATSNGELEHRDDDVLRQLLVEHSGPAFDWLRSIGLQFIGPTEEPPFTKPRMHNIIPNSRAYITELEKRARGAGVSVRTDFRVQGLRQDESGRVVGVHGPSRLTARRGVVLATGDYSANAELKAKWMGEQSAALPPVNPLSTGDGFTMALDLGATVKNTDLAVEDLRLRPPQNATAGLVSRLPSTRGVARLLRIAIERLPRPVVTRFVRAVLTGHVAPSQVLFQAGAVLVNAEGDRFTNELRTPARALADQAVNECYVVFDARLARMFSAWPHPLSTFPGVAYAYLRDYERFRPDAIRKAATLEGLATAIGAAPTQLAAAVSRFNDGVGSGADDEFGRPAGGDRLAEAPFYALGPLSGFVTITDGGLVLDAQCRVLDEDGQAIPGLFAAGSTGQGGLVLKNHGLHVAWAITSGRIAGARVLDLDPPAVGREARA